MNPVRPGFLFTMPGKEFLVNGQWLSNVTFRVRTVSKSGIVYYNVDGHSRKSAAYHRTLDAFTEELKTGVRVPVGFDDAAAPPA